MTILMMENRVKHDHMTNPKNMKVMLSVLGELGVDVKGCKASDLSEVINAFEYFLEEVSKVK